MTNLQLRQVAIEIQGNIATIKTAVDALSTAVDAVNTVAAAWTLDGLDDALPTAADVAAQVTAYNALSVSLSKPPNNLDDAISAVQAAVV